ncbi:MAG: hypothetical protein ACLPVW_10275 [Terriglobales bacterium]
MAFFALWFWTRNLLKWLVFMTGSFLTKRIPGREEFLAGVAAYDGNTRVYFEALRGLQAGWGDPTKMADAIWPVLCDWHADYYRRGRGDPRAIAFGIEENISLLDGFRNRTVDTLCGADEPKIRELFWTFQKVTGRTNSRGSDASPVGAAKALHLLCPHFLSLWDNAIADLYRCDHEAFGYAKFCRLMKEFAAAVQPYLGTSDDRSVLKRVDEYNWSITRPRRAS